MMKITLFQVVCVMTTTSCFAPRSPDNLPAIARICAEHGVPHLVNNAYGVQSEHCCRLINEVKNCINLFETLDFFRPQPREDWTLSSRAWTRTSKCQWAEPSLLR